MTKCDGDHDNYHFIMVFLVLVGFIFGAGTYGAFRGNEEVNVASFGNKLCESQGLVYKNYTMMEGQVPQITCTDKTEPPKKSLYDGVVVYEPNAWHGCNPYIKRCDVDKNIVYNE